MQFRGFFLNALKDFKNQPCAPLRGAPVCIPSVIESRAHKTAQEEEMRGMDLDTVKPRFPGPNGCCDKLIPDKADFVLCHSIRLCLLRPSVIRSQSKLGDNGRMSGMYEICQASVLGNQRIIAKTHHAFEVVVIGRHTGKAGDDGSNAAAGQLIV